MVGVVTSRNDWDGPTNPVVFVGTTMAVGTGVVVVPLPAPTALIPIGTLDSPGAGIGVVLFTPVVAAPVVVAPVVVVVAGGGAVRCARPKVLVIAMPAAI